MLCKKYSGIVALLVLILSLPAYSQNVLDLVPYNGTPGSYLVAQIKADTAANHGYLPDRVYRLQRGGLYLNTEILNIDSGQTVRITSSDGTDRMPLVYQYPTGTGANAHRPPGNLFVLRGGNVEMRDVIVSGYFEPVDTNINNVQGGLINTTQPGCSITIDGCILTNINGQHVRTGSATAKVKIVNSIFANMGALTSSNFGAGKALDLREASCDSLILVNNTFVNYQDRIVRHYNFSSPLTGTGNINYCLIDHNSFINGMGFHGLLSLGNVGSQVIITNNLFVDAFAAGEDELEPNGTRAAEWANTGETYANGTNRMMWIFTAPNDTTHWTVKNNFFAVSDSGQAFLDANGLRIGDPLSWHINRRLGADSVNAFTKVNISMTNIPMLMTNLMRWYRSPNGGNFTKNTPSTLFNFRTDDMDRRVAQYYSDTLDASYAASSPAYRGGINGYPAGDLNWFPDKKALWEAGVVPFSTTIDGQKDEFYNSLTGPGDGYLQLRSFVNSNNGRPANDADLSAKVWSSWNEEWFYMYIEVKDDTLSGNSANVWEVDEMELKIDPVPDDSTETGNTMFEARLTALSLADGARVQDSLNNVTAENKQFARIRTTDGYVLEYGIKWAVIRSTNGETVNPVPGTQIGVALNIHDNDAARRQATVMWAAVLNDNAYQTPKYLGTVTLLDGNKMQWVATNKMTGHVNPLPYDGSDEPGVGVEKMPNIPTVFSLSQNYPNPFNPATIIEFGIPKQSQVRLNVYNLLGQKVAELINDELQPGFYKTSFNASALPSGIYFYRIEAGSFTQTKKLSFVK